MKNTLKIEKKKEVGRKTIFQKLQTFKAKTFQVSYHITEKQSPTQNVLLVLIITILTLFFKNS